ncbi:DUF6545 domain-containing protein [Streptomyces sp. NPDC051064]|uniref:DUF6545 domain-containing protein n=2 Tax=unclassified Streptomyces TaxID=2593676 RepID=UPI003799DD91
MDDRLSRAGVNLRVAPVNLLDALCSLSGRPAPPSGPHPARRVYGRVLHAATSLPLGALQPGDVSAATEVRAGLLNAHVPPLSDAVARCIQHTVDDLGPADLWTLARCTAMTRDDLAWGGRRISGAGTPRTAGLTGRHRRAGHRGRNRRTDPVPVGRHQVAGPGEALGSLWQDLSAAMPQIVLTTTDDAQDSSNDSDFLLQRRVIEISDGSLALRAYRPRAVQEAAQDAFGTGTEERAAAVEAAVLKAALAGLRTGRVADDIAPPPAGVASRKDLRAATEWLLLVTDAYANRVGRVRDDGRPELVGG